jgi:hypothetical protein
MQKNESETYSPCFKKGDEVMYEEDMNATVIEEFKNGLVKINVANFGEISVLKKYLKLK